MEEGCAAERWKGTHRCIAHSLGGLWRQARNLAETMVARGRSTAVVMMIACRFSWIVVFCLATKCIVGLGSGMGMGMGERRGGGVRGAC